MSACRFILSKQIFRSMHSMAILTLYGPHVHIVTKRTSLSRDCGTDAQSKRRFYEPQHVSLVPIAEAAHITLFAPHQAYLPLSWTCFDLLCSGCVPDYPSSTEFHWADVASQGCLLRHLHQCVWSIQSLTPVQEGHVISKTVNNYEPLSDGIWRPDFIVHNEAYSDLIWPRSILLHLLLLLLSVPSVPKSRDHRSKDRKLCQGAVDV